MWKWPRWVSGDIARWRGGVRCRVSDLGFEVWGWEFRVSGSGCREEGPGFWVQEMRFRVHDLGFSIKGLGFRI